MRKKKLETVGNQMLAADLNNLWRAIALENEHHDSKVKIENILKTRNYTKIITESENRLMFEFHINSYMLREVYYKHFKKNDCAMSDIMLHKATKTKWALQFFPMWSKNCFNDKTAEIYLNLMNKSSSVDKIIINQYILCKQNQIEFKFFNNTYESTGKDWSKFNRYLIILPGFPQEIPQKHPGNPDRTSGNPALGFDVLI